MAQAVNAKANDLFFDSYEESDTWNGVVLDNTKAHAGRYSARLDNSSGGEIVRHSTQWLNVTLSAPTKFKYSGWVYSNGPSADIYFFMKRANETGYYSYVDGVRTTTTGKWVLVEGEFTVPADVTQLNIRIDNNEYGTVWFDDIRLHPSASQMTTFTYDPLVGMTSQSDINNRITYFEYDGFGRLSLVRDDNKNILKRYCYNYLGQPGDCGEQPTQWGNEPINDYYYSNYCGSQTPEPYMVSVSSGMFTSLISQQDANNQAVQYAQQQADLLGGCQSLLTLTYSNYYNAYGYTVELYNNSTGNSYFFEVGYGSGTLGDIPAGNYNIYFNSPYDSNYRTFSAGCYYSTSGYGGANLYSVDLNASCNNLEIY
ncbi:carbohydrate binding domain-containing protein [Chitinophagaceae bacterium LB-8]|uniref:Carbohydrate binding domain-containing protein n=1 Tax=Paraflavisolibacter caeni TaxID=2982496 RepID=A0A9X2XNN7_9BACT|nr:carbohydrate binding domain-containing protein [Paraflavisolibacter caeni]MCU7549223.1 carbohydrate binding domain-containing protein [Paraflavisolibacter caeni]